jgi:hypothetical protein
LVITGLNIAGLYGLYQAELAGLLPPPTVLERPMEIGRWLTISFINLFVALLLFLARVGVERNFAVVERQTAELSQRNEALRQLQDNLEERVAERSKSAEQARQQAETAQALLSDQLWQISGQAELIAALRGEQETTSLARHIVEKTCEIVGAALGALYVERDGRFHLTASYAFTHRKGLNLSFAPGEGLIGQAALEKQPIILANPPDDYLPITAGLTRMQPAELWPCRCSTKNGRSACWNWRKSAR